VLGPRLIWIPGAMPQADGETAPLALDRLIDLNGSGANLEARWQNENAQAN